ncbi:MAG: cytochrome c [Rhodospirillales bacterium]|nr:cytochrome c [Rhodospirillales bacterium]
MIYRSVFGVLLLASNIVAGVGLIAAPAEAEPSSARQNELIYRLRHDCGSCHGMTLKGGLGPPLVAAKIAETDQEQLVETILHGVEGTPMPPWNFEINRDEAAWLVRLLKKGVRYED